MTVPSLVEVTALYDDEPDVVFAAALQFDELMEAMSGLAVYDGLAPGTIAKEGKTYTVNVTFWGFIKMKGHQMFVEKLDITARELQSRESGNGIKRWDHNLSVRPEGAGARWVDHIEIDAGWQTPFVARFARFVYTRRHKHRKALEITRSITSA